MSYACKMSLHGSMAKGGSLYQWELVDYPGVYICDIKQTRNSKVKRTITYDKRDFATIEDAVNCWKRENEKR